MDLAGTRGELKLKTDVCIIARGIALENSRLRLFGGSTTVWGGRCTATQLDLAPPAFASAGLTTISAKLFLPGIDWKNEHRTSNIEHRTSNIEW
ncbi:hypothetical protein [Desulfoglaeba alkanexedens]|uniref:Uncharacterized protein n=1 Tax=Desulfoglaeba alkanexedens ALDC TaxID=980445 RepID=A0A4P8L4J0_9BACT|nr:hypothetical protein [Desulfoglaeba alkanexedens]QCQ22754.1 hypothetical protein FDQ92_11555 [Desulfoglaeba alkanexedens ALDC]